MTSPRCRKTRFTHQCGVVLFGKVNHPVIELGMCCAVEGVGPVEPYRDIPILDRLALTSLDRPEPSWSRRRRPTADHRRQAKIAPLCCSTRLRHRVKARQRAEKCFLISLVDRAAVFFKQRPDRMGAEYRIIAAIRPSGARRYRFRRVCCMGNDRRHRHHQTYVLIKQTFVHPYELRFDVKKAHPLWAEGLQIMPKRAAARKHRCFSRRFRGRRWRRPWPARARSASRPAIARILRRPGCASCGCRRWQTGGWLWRRG